MSEDNTPDVVGGNAQKRLVGFVERLERMAEEIAELQGDVKEIFAEAKVEGFNVVMLRKVIRLRKMDPAKRQEEEALFDLYWAAINGMPEDEGDE